MARRHPPEAGAMTKGWSAIDCLGDDYNFSAIWVKFSGISMPKTCNQITRDREEVTSDLSCELADRL